MKIFFTKISDKEHSLKVQRNDGSEEEKVMNTRSFLNHDFAHIVIESELPLVTGYWGQVSSGNGLGGMDMKGKELIIAESLAGPMQTWMRTGATVEELYKIIEKIQPDFFSDNLVKRMYEKIINLQGEWKSIAYGHSMILTWNEKIKK